MAPFRLFFLTTIPLALATACATAREIRPEAHARWSPYGQGLPVVKTMAPVGLSRAQIERYLHNKGSNIQTPRPGVWHLSIDGVIVLTILERERIRIMAPIFSLEQLDGELGVQHALLQRLLQANFDQAADARYAIFDGIVFATVTQPRSALDEDGLERYFAQVVNLHKNTFRTGRTGYSTEPPDPDSIEIDPRKDETLDVPDGYDRLTPSPKPMQVRGSYTEL